MNETLNSWFRRPTKFQPVVGQSSDDFKHDLYVVYRGQLEHEDNLVGIRNGWLIAGQSFLFAGYAAVLAVTQSSGNGFVRTADELSRELPWIGLVLAAMAFVAVNAALYRSNQLCKWFTKLNSRPSAYPPLQSPVLLELSPKRLGHAVARCVPLVFVGAWIYQLVNSPF